MSDSYNHKGVTITPQGGGFYLLTHPSLPDPIRERGKEKAEQRADSIIASLAPDDGESSIPPQGDFPEAAPVVESAEVAALKARIAELEAAGVKTVVATAVAPEDDPTIRAQIPTHFDGAEAEAQRELMDKLGISYKRIVLEENESIPPTGLFVSHNGRAYVIQPGTPVNVPDFVLNVLKDAKMSAPVVDSKTQKVLGYRDRMKYPWRLAD